MLKDGILLRKPLSLQRDVALMKDTDLTVIGASAHRGNGCLGGIYRKTGQMWVATFPLEGWVIYLALARGESPLLSKEGAWDLCPRNRPRGYC